MSFLIMARKPWNRSTLVAKSVHHFAFAIINLEYLSSNQTIHGIRINNEYERAIGDCVLAKICYHNAHCNGDSNKWNILDYIDIWLLWKSIGLHALADDANALYPSTPIRPVLWTGDLVIGHLTLKINRALYSATMHLCMKFCEAMSKHSWLKRDNFI